MRRPTRIKVMLALTGMLASLLAIVSPGTAQAAESIPTLQWSPPAIVGDYAALTVTSPTGSVTVACNSLTGGGSLTTYDVNGQVIQQIDRTSVIDGVTNCIEEPAVDKNGHVYGVPWGEGNRGRMTFGPNLLAYNGNTLKWKYPVTCGNADRSVAVGADGNIYTLVSGSNGIRLIGLTPEAAPGQTQPTKVLDIEVPGGCETEIHPYKHGLMLRGWQSGNPRYYNYAGHFLGQATIGNFDNEKIDVDGRLFVRDNASPSIAVFDPRTGTVEWTYPFYANTMINDWKPLPGGGMTAVVDQPAVNGGIPSPTQRETALVVISPLGQKTQEVTLPASSTVASYVALGAFLAVDDSHKVVVVRSMGIPTGTSNPSLVSGFSIGVYDIPSATWSYQEVMTGDLNKPGGPNGYNVARYPSGAVMAEDTVFITARCTNNCDYYGEKLYAFDVPGIGMDYPRGEMLDTSPRPSSAFIALGDSFSSGEGVEPFEAGTDEGGVNMCHRSENAYPRLLEAEHSGIPSLGSYGFRACSGATTEHLGSFPQWNEGLQLGVHPDETTQVVTLTIGGNNIGFKEFGEACFWDTCQEGSTAYNDSISKINGGLLDDLKETYRHVLRNMPNAEVYVIGYPQVMAEKTPSAPFDSRCPYMHNSGPNDTGSPHYPWEDAWAARDIVERLNGKIEAAVTAVQNEDSDNQRLAYVPLDEPGSPFIGHEVCGTASSSWFQNVDQGANDPAYVFHPNGLGLEGIATVVGAEID